MSSAIHFSESIGVAGDAASGARASTELIVLQGDDAVHLRAGAVGIVIPRDPNQPARFFDNDRAVAFAAVNRTVFHQLVDALGAAIASQP